MDATFCFGEYNYTPEPFCWTTAPNALPTFNTQGTENYGIIGSPKVTLVSSTPVPNFGTVVPSDPNNDYKPPSWESAAVWTCRGVAGLCLLGAVGVAAWGALGGETMDVAVNVSLRAAPKFLHFSYGVGGIWEQAVRGLGNMWIITGSGAELQITGIPVLFGDAVLAGDAGVGAFNCFTAVVSALARGWGG
jgi:hypothetical protein